MYKALDPGAIGVRVDLAEAARLAAKYGFAGVPVSLEEVEKLGVERARQILAEAGQRPAFFHGWGVDARGPEAEFTAGLETLRARCKVAVALGVDRTATWIAPASDERDFDTNYAFHKARFTAIARVLAEHGLRLGLEFVGPKTARDGKKYPFIYTLEGMEKLCHDIGTGNVGLLLDIYHWYTSGGKPADLDHLTDADLVLVHLNDAPAGVPIEKQMDLVRTLPGETGVAGVPAFLRALVRAGYTGPAVVEPFSQKLKGLPAEEAVRLTAESLDKVWKEAGLIGRG